MMKSSVVHDFFSFFQSDDSDIWDDTALIKAYDKAVASFKVTLMTLKRGATMQLIQCRLLCFFSNPAVVLLPFLLNSPECIERRGQCDTSQKR